MIEDSDLSLDRLPGHLRPPGPAPPAAPKPSKGKGKARENVPPLSFGASTSAGPSAAAPSTVDPYADLREHIEDAEFEADFGLDPDAEAKPDELVIFEQDEQSDSQEVRSVLHGHADSAQEEEEFARTGIRPVRLSQPSPRLISAGPREQAADQGQGIVGLQQVEHAGRCGQRQSGHHRRPRQAGQVARSSARQSQPLQGRRLPQVCVHERETGADHLQRWARSATSTSASLSARRLSTSSASAPRPSSRCAITLTDLC